MQAVENFDAVIVGGGHNGLVAAAYLASAGLSVLLLERSGELGGAAVSSYAFEGMDARLSRYSYLVSLLPPRIIDDLGLDLTLKRRRYSSYTPVPHGTGGLLIDNDDSAATRASFASIDAEADHAAYQRLAADLSRIATVLWPTLAEPLPTRAEARRMLGDDALWEEFFERPLGESIRRRFTHDLVRGVVATDALIGTFASVDDDSLAQNICFLYHVIGQGTGDWDVPEGGMGAVSGELERAARLAGARLRTNCEVVRVTPEGEVVYLDPSTGAEVTVTATRILSNVAPTVLDALLGETGGTAPGEPAPEGAQVKVNLLLSRLPVLRDPAVAPEAAFGGTFHINERLSDLERAHAEAAAGAPPAVVPAEIYCHSLTDPSILSSELQRAGAHTLTVFALHVPHRLLLAGATDREQLQSAVLESLDSVLGEPIEPLLLTDSRGRPCIETKTTADLEEALALPGGNIFHGALGWPFAEDGEQLDSAAERWGVATRHPRILLCGSGSRRGGAVSGLGGHSAAMAVLEERLDSV
ncbi:NAD(P)/FAD-dependent oxidoreductase [Herbiconiux moechotypicola]|uniref:Pyridine nucleotide-disulfide oxidoreductase domain-containing protein 2 n=1 Tax=Herbiconiux moechotypicola TaxID=637393 RepID=A0ABN3DBW2_9MICO|nr:NAD(P)/FAD-dependent oxidoreductase [Herbiconiux moechotypicola]MCS5728832.1 NAD(P)/FAD-dependent oxidoreductase [Herbiconiux moechotypicola]